MRPAHSRITLVDAKLSLMLLRRGQMVQAEALTLQCHCGYAVLCEVERWGERVGTLAFSDHDPSSETYSQRVNNCPGCGEHLELPRLFVKSIRR
jgi:hypothetical protein